MMDKGTWIRLLRLLSLAGTRPRWKKWKSFNFVYQITHPFMHIIRLVLSLEFINKYFPFIYYTSA